MLNPISLEDAQAANWDVIVAGSSFAAMFFAHGLPEGLSVLVVEKGAFESHEDIVAQGFLHTETFEQDNRSGHLKEWRAHTLFGGNSNCWWAQTPRFHPSDFRLKALYGLGEDWPLDYAALEPFYQQVEALMEIAGGGSDHILPRSAPFPFPPHPPSRSDRVLMDARPDIWVPVPTARANGGARNQCCANGVCDRCPVDAKFTILNAPERLFGAGHRLLTGTEVRRVVHEGGRAAGVVVLGQGEVALAAPVVGRVHRRHRHAVSVRRLSDQILSEDSNT